MEDLKKALQSPFKKGIILGTLNSKGYFKCFRENVYDNQMDEEHQKMFNHGSGGELHSKARAVHSSSMLGYNFFSWIDESHPFIWEDIIYTKVYFEVQLRTIKRSPAPANMDIVLEGQKDGKRVLMFIESKFLEYSTVGKYTLSESYSDSKKYFGGCEEWSHIDHEMRIETRSEEKRYNEGLKQSFCHLVALNALHNTDALKWFNQNNGSLNIHNLADVEIRFMNAIFCPLEDFDEYEKYCDYEDYYSWFMHFIKRIAPHSVQPKWFNYSQIWNEMKIQIKDPKRIEYIQHRYMDFAKKC